MLIACQTPKKSIGNVTLAFTKACPERNELVKSYLREGFIKKKSSLDIEMHTIIIQKLKNSLGNL
tara:strand:+ start:2848 stop:3042 length:195 start_codon:yes stop_codon:yes gene_type:complete